MLIQEKVNYSCYHCGDKCANNIISSGEKIFCCEGCKMVYEILEENGLCNYYNLNEKNGNKVQSFPTGRFAYLDDIKIAGQLLSFNEGETAVVNFYIPHIHCSSCIWLLEKLHDLKEGITRSQINFLKKEVTITFHPNQISLRQVVELLVNIGYDPELNLQSLEQPKNNHNGRRLVYQIGLTGFCFGNIMLLSFPEYLSGSSYIDPTLKHFFGYLNMLLALPAVIFGAQDYFINAFKGIRQRYFNIDFPIALGITAAVGRSTYEILSHTGAGYLDSITGLVFFLLIGKYFQNKTYQTLSFERDYRSYFPLAVNVKQNGKEESLAVSNLKPGDRMIIHNEEVVPADSLLMSVHAQIDYSFVTGESRPVWKKKGDLIYAGGRQKGAAVELEVIKNVSRSYLTELWNNEAFTKKKTENISRLADKISKWFTIAILSIGLITFIYWYPRDVRTAILSVTSLLVIACPCALAITVPFTLGHVMRLLGRVGFYVKNTSVLETMAGIDEIVFDKTGTLTLPDSARIEFIGDNLGEEERILIASLSYHSTHPLSRRLFDSMKDVNLLKVKEFTETQGKGIEGIVGEHTIKSGSASFVGIGQQVRDNSVQKVFVSIDGHVPGYFAFYHSFREGMDNVMQELRNHYKLNLVSGDGEGEKEKLLYYFKEEEMHFNQSPSDKLNFISACRNENHKVLMVGDGLNDAGALQNADTGISITDKVTQFAPASDVIMDGNTAFEKLPSILRFTKGGIRIIGWIFAFSLLYNVAGISLAVQGKLSPMIAAILMPISSISVIALATVSTRIMAKRLKLV